LPEKAMRKLVRKAQAGDAAAMNKLLLHNQLLVANEVHKKIQQSRRFRILSPMDLMQEGIFGLRDGYLHFDLKRGFKLSTYIVWWIKKVIRRTIAAKDRLIFMPEYLDVKEKKMHAAMKDQKILHYYIDIDCPIRSLARMTYDNVDGQSVKTIKEPKSIRDIRERTAVARVNFLDIDEPFVSFLAKRNPVSGCHNSLGATNEGMPNEHASAGDKTVSFSGSFDDYYDYQAMIKKIIPKANLTPREMIILTKRYALDGGEALSSQIISKELNLSRERVRQIEWEAIKKIRRAHSRNGGAAEIACSAKR
jgi:RNA polymerase sigma factor (sigma-70 family)